MTIVNTDIMPATPSVVVDDRKASLIGMDMSESLFDYDLLLGEVGTNNRNNTSSSDKDTDSLLESFFPDDNEEVSDNTSSNSLSPPQQMDLLKRPKLMQWGPQDGQEVSTIVSIVFEHTEETGPMKIVFGSITVETAQQQHSMVNNNNSNSVWITLAASVPSFADTRSTSNEVKLSVCLFDRHDPDLAVDTWDIGKFTYCSDTEDSQNSKHRKRALSCESIELPQKKTTFAAVKRHDEEENDDVNYQLLKLLAPYDPLINLDAADQLVSPPASNSSWTDSPVNNHNSAPYTTTSNIMLQHGMVNSRPMPNQIMYGMNSQQHYMSAKQQMYKNYLEMQQRQKQQQQHYQQQHPQQNFIMQQQQQQHHLMSQAMNSYMSNPMHNFNNNNAPNYYPKFGNNNDNNSFLYNMSEQQQRQNIERAKQLQQQQQHFGGLEAPRRASAPASSYSITNSNSCALNKAHLKLNGDLMDMIVNWNMSEWQSGRRLVQFWRHTKKDADGNLSLVECGFDPMDQQVYHQQRMRDNVAAVAAAAAAAVAVSNSPSAAASLNATTNNNRPTPIVISCIYWRERNDYFITSVDCIYLLESLIGIQFTVEEKNRIRRNLEGFRPLTVSKCKSECADFFKLVMSFPHPKPRNIEKDVKVFSWKTLPHALRKIIRKYTPSYTTTTPLEPIHQRSMSLTANNNSSGYTTNSPF